MSRIPGVFVGTVVTAGVVGVVESSAQTIAENSKLSIAVSKVNLPSTP